MSSTVIDRTKAPEARDITSFSLLPAKQHELPNGIPVTYLVGGAQPIITLQIEFEASRLHEPKHGISSYMAKMLGEGTKSHTSGQISEHFEAYGAFWQASASPDRVTLEVYCLAKHFGKVLPMVRELLQEAVFPEEEWMITQAIEAQRLKMNLGRNSFRASRQFKSHIFGAQHPYGYNTQQYDIQAVSAEELKAFYQDHIVNAPFHIFLSGQIEDEHFKLLEEYLGQSSVKSDKNQTPPMPELSTVFKPYYEEKAEALQSSVRIGKPFFLKNHPDHVPFFIVNTLLGGYFGSRLMQNIREEKGLSYGINSGLMQTKHSSMFFIQAEVQKAKKDEALSEVYKEMKRLCEEPVGEEELHRVKNYRCASLMKSITSPVSILECHKNIWMYDLPSDYYDTYTDKIWSVTAEQVQQLAQKYLSGDFVEVVVG